ncbi:MAG: winged helix DNA-binding domain-containing protein [Candidatus Hermodarchaeota archaeon]
MKTITLDRVNRLVLWKQYLTDESRTKDIVQIVQNIGGLHATSATTPYLSLFARIRDFNKDNLDEALYVKKDLGKIRCMRKTLHILAKEWIPVAYAATKGIVEKSSKKHMEFRGVSSKQYEEISKSILDILTNNKMTASELKKQLNTPLPVSTILYYMCDQGLLIRDKPKKGWKDKIHTYSAFQVYFPSLELSKLGEQEAIAQLVQTYMKSFGPVTEKDIVWWTGLGKTQIRRILEEFQEQLIPIKISELEGDFTILGTDEWLLEHNQIIQEKIVNFLPILDPYLMGYKERERYLRTEHYIYVFDRSGNATSTIIYDGQVIGIWDFTEEPEPLVKLFLFEEVENKALKEIYSKARKIGQFIANRQVQIKECDSMVPLTERTAGGMMSPLKFC